VQSPGLFALAGDNNLTRTARSRDIQRGAGIGCSERNRNASASA
jgi:hypothetical protein